VRIWRKEFQGPLFNFWKVARSIFEIFLNSRVPVGILVDRGLILDKCKGFFAKWQRISVGYLFFNRKYGGGPGPWRVDRGGVVKRVQRCFAGAWHVGARARRCSPATVEEGKLDEAVLEGCSPEHERR
jgi:hypothetical protein